MLDDCVGTLAEAEVSRKVMRVVVDLLELKGDGFRCAGLGRLCVGRNES